MYTVTFATGRKVSGILAITPLDAMRAAQWVAGNEAGRIVRVMYQPTI